MSIGSTMNAVYVLGIYMSVRGDIEIDQRYVQLDSVRVFDEYVVDYFDKVPEGDLMEEVSKVMKTGVLKRRKEKGSESMEESNGDMPLHRLEGDEFLYEFFDDEDEVLGLHGEFLGDERDVDSFGFTVGELLSQIRERLSDEIEVIEVDEGIASSGGLYAEADSKSMRVGDIFGEVLMSLSALTGDKITIHGEAEEELVVELNEIPSKILFRSAEEDISIDGLKRDMVEGLKSTGSEYGVLVSKTVESLPQDLGLFTEFDGFLVIAGSENGEPRPGVIELAYRWARIKVFESEGDLLVDSDMSKMVP